MPTNPSPTEREHSYPREHLPVEQVGLHAGLGIKEERLGERDGPLRECDILCVVISQGQVGDRAPVGTEPVVAELRVDDLRVLLAVAAARHLRKGSKTNAGGEPFRKLAPSCFPTISSTYEQCLQQSRDKTQARTPPDKTRSLLARAPARPPKISSTRTYPRVTSGHVAGLPRGNGAGQAASRLIVAGPHVGADAHKVPPVIAGRHDERQVARDGVDFRLGDLQQGTAVSEGANTDARCQNGRMLSLRWGLCTCPSRAERYGRGNTEKRRVKARTKRGVLSTFLAGSSMSVHVPVDDLVDGIHHLRGRLALGENVPVVWE